jgi:hypothetical protein
MVLLSGKREKKTKLLRLIDPCLKQQFELVHQHLLYGTYKGSLSKQVAKMAELYVLSNQIDGQLHHSCTPIRLCPEYELYHAWIGVPETYDEKILTTIKESVRKKIPYSKIKSNLKV